MDKLAAGIADLRTYIRNNRGSIPNDGERYRQGETISTAYVESTINQVVSRRFVKKQQMAWTLRGAHLLLQTRTKVLNNELEDVFRRWFPQFRLKVQTNGPEQEAECPPASWSSPRPRLPACKPPSRNCLRRFCASGLREKAKRRWKCRSMDERKTKASFPLRQETLEIAIGAIPTFPPSRRLACGNVEIQTQDSHFPQPREACGLRKNGPLHKTPEAPGRCPIRLDSSDCSFDQVQSFTPSNEIA